MSAADIEWVAERLMRHGGREAWEKGTKLCPDAADPGDAQPHYGRPGGVLPRMLED